MSIEIKAYRCEFHVNGCTKSPMLHRRSMEKHEATCIANPANRTCKTCKFDAQEEGVHDGLGNWLSCGSAWCDHDEHDREGSFERNCPDWEPKL